MKKRRLIILSAGLIMAACSSHQETTVDADPLANNELDRSVLPIKEPKRPTYKELDVKDATAPPRFEVNAPKGAPNVVVILIDDMGFGVSESFG